MQPVEYFVVGKGDRDKLIDEINKMLAWGNGWRPEGGIYIGKGLVGIIFFQVMVRYE